MSQRPKLFLIDVSAFIFRAFFAIPNLSTSKGYPTNATYGFLSMVLKIIDTHKPDGVICVFDSKEPSFRKEEYSEYKANRGAPPEKLVPQFDDVARAVELLGFCRAKKIGFEADDIIAAAAKKFATWDIVIVTGDKDLMQLVDDRVKMLDTMKDVLYGPAEVEAKLGVPPRLVTDYLGLIGDSSDNIPGVPGVGPKTAVDMLKEHGSLEAVLIAAPGMKGKKALTLVQHADDARLSKRLATVMADMNVDGGVLPELNDPALKPVFPVSPGFVSFLQNLELHSLAKKYGVSSTTESFMSSSVAVVTPPISAQSSIVTNEKDWKNCLHELSRATRVGIYGEPAQGESHKRGFTALSLTSEGGRSFYIIEPSASQVRELAQALSSVILVGHDLKDVFKAFLNSGVTLDLPIKSSHRPWFDTRIAHYLMDAEEKQDLVSVAMRLADLELPARDVLLGKEGTWLALDQSTAIAAATDWSNAVLHLTEPLSKYLKDSSEESLFYDIEMPVVFVLAVIERNGISVDSNVLSVLSKKFASELATTEAAIFKLTDCEFNLNSPKQLSEVLFEKLKLPVVKKTKTGFSTDVEVLEKLAHLHEVPAKILRYRELTKLKSTYVDVLPGLVESDGRVHARFNQTVTATGRLSSSDPNLQNIPVKSIDGKRIRSAFVAEQGNVLVGADYSQVELRIVAHLSRDEALLSAFRAGRDVHRATAAEIFSVDSDSVTPEQRNVAKAINFGLIYGKTAFGLSQELGISRADAQLYIDNYFKRYSAVKTFMDQSMAEAREFGYAKTLFGRRRRIRDIDSKNMAVRNNAERMAMNTPVQGTAADIMKMAMVGFARRTKEFNARIVLQVHDELVLEVPEQNAQAAARALREEMMSAARLSVPLDVDAAQALNWMELS